MISKAKSRSTTVQGEVFRYKVSSKPVSKGVYELNITIQSERHNACKLLVRGIFEWDYNVKPPQSREDYNYLPTIIHDDIDGFINEAIEQGWDFAKRGCDFELQCSNEIFRLIWREEQPPPDWFHGRNFNSDRQRN